jgi:hypothetical protein
MKLFKLTIVLCLFVAIVSAGYYPGGYPGATDGEQNSQSNGNHDSVASNGHHASNNRFVNAAKKKNYNQFAHRQARSKLAKQHGKSRSQYADAANHNKNTNAFNKDNIDNNVDNIGFNKENINKLNRNTGTHLNKQQDDINSGKNNFLNKNNLSKRNANSAHANSFANNVDSSDSTDKNVPQGSSGSGGYGSGSMGGNFGARKTYSKHNMGNSRGDANQNALDMSNINAANRNHFNRRKRGTDFNTHDNTNALNKDAINFNKNDVHQKRRKANAFNQNENSNHHTFKNNNANHDAVYADNADNTDAGTQYNDASALKKGDQNQVYGNTFAKDSDAHNAMGRSVDRNRY